MVDLQKFIGKNDSGDCRFSFFLFFFAKSLLSTLPNSPRDLRRQQQLQHQLSSGLSSIRDEEYPLMMTEQQSSGGQAEADTAKKAAVLRVGSAKAALAGSHHHPSARLFPSRNRTGSVDFDLFPKTSSGGGSSSSVMNRMHHLQLQQHLHHHHHHHGHHYQKQQQQHHHHHQQQQQPSSASSASASPSVFQFSSSVDISVVPEENELPATTATPPPPPQQEGEEGTFAKRHPRVGSAR